MNKIKYRHGDVPLYAIEKKSGLEEIEFGGDFTLALGEATGHKHRIIADRNAVKIFKHKDGQFVIQVIGHAELTHEEHQKFANGSKIVAPGWYKIGANGSTGGEKEYNYFSNSVQKVID